MNKFRDEVGETNETNSKRSALEYSYAGRYQQSKMDRFVVVENSKLHRLFWMLDKNSRQVHDS